MLRRPFRTKRGGDRHAMVLVQEGCVALRLRVARGPVLHRVRPGAGRNRACSAESRGPSRAVAARALALAARRETGAARARADGEDVAARQGGPGDPGRHRQRHPRGRAQVPARFDPRRRQFQAGGRPGGRAGKMAGTVRCVSSRGDGHPRRRRGDPAAVRCGRGARQQRRVRFHGVSAQHRVGCHPRPRPDRRDRPGHRARGARGGHQLGFRAHAHGAAGRSLGPHLRRLFGKPRPGGAVRGSGRGGTAGQARHAAVPGRRARHRQRQAFRG